VAALFVSEIKRECANCTKKKKKIVRISQSAFLKKVLKILLTFVEQGCILTKVAEHGNNKSTK
jgi:hypothetical protein